MNPDNGKIYIGRTSGYGTPQQNIAARNRNHHADRRGYTGDPILLFTTSSYVQARAVEEGLITGLDAINKGGNARHGIWPGYPFHKPLVDAVVDNLTDVADTAKDLLE